MEQAKHTPGPWIQMGTSIGVTHGEIASVWEIDGRSFANARLIAAAPDLLEALQEMWDAHEHNTSGSVSKLVLDAITKATGTNQ